MKKDTILIAIAIGLAVFLMRWFRAFTPIENYEVHFLPLFGIYFGMRRHFKTIKIAHPKYPVTFLRSFWFGIEMSLIASFVTGVLCLLFVQYPTETVKFYSPWLLHAIPFTSTAAYGVLVSILCSSVIVYFKPIKIDPNKHIKLHPGHHLLY
jgi:hypothetical protein